MQNLIASLLGNNRPMLIFVIAIAVAILVVLAVVIWRLVGRRGIRAPSGGRGRVQRLGIVDAFDVDRERQLVLVRRDNVEHLLMIGGPNDLLIESSIVRIEPRVTRDKDVAAPVALTMPAVAAQMPPPVIMPVAPAIQSEPAPKRVPPPQILPAAPVVPPPVRTPPQPAPLPSAPPPRPIVERPRTPMQPTPAMPASPLAAAKPAEPDAIAKALLAALGSALDTAPTPAAALEPRPIPPPTRLAPPPIAAMRSAVERFQPLSRPPISLDSPKPAAAPAPKVPEPVRPIEPAKIVEPMRPNERLASPTKALALPAPEGDEIDSLEAEMARLLGRPLSDKT